jgi:class 3 adenylate cyclase/tetratricopeptide (TPR) repeat protein/Arc/MetJ family transcription regulator
MERKLATVLFVDLVDSTSLLSGADPEIVRRKVTRYFECASERIQLHGGTVEKFAGDAVMAAFGVPQAHEDDAERAVRAAFDVLEAVHELGLEARVGIEAGELVVDDVDSTFATGEAVVVAARLQQSAQAGTIGLGPVARRLTVGAIDVEDAGSVEIRPGEQTWSWRVLRVLDMRRRRPRARFVGREHELELLHNSYDRTVRDGRSTLITVFGEPGVGKSRLVEEFTSGVERATVLTGRALPYGEGVAFWPIASMVKASAGITDDDPAAEAFEKLRVSCESEAVADLLGVALGVLGAADDAGASTETTWAALRWAEQLATAQPLVLVFEDVQWADERMLDVIEHLARSLRDAPVLIVCVARFELLEERVTWGGGNPRATAVELTPLPESDSAELADTLLPAEETPPALRALVLERAEGNPLFLEETARMLLEADGSKLDDRIPDSVQALIAARIDLLPNREKRLLQHAAVIGRVFWRGALNHLAPELVDDRVFDALCDRDLISIIERSAIPGDRAYQFSHVLIREVAYAGMTKAERAVKHREFADWLEQRESGEDLVEIRAHHLDQTTALLEELEGSVPPELAARTAAALEQAGHLALARDSFGAARRLFRRSLELEPTLDRRYEAAAAARGLNEFTTVAMEMERVQAEAREQGDAAVEGRAVTALAEIAMLRDGEPAEAARLATRALELLPDDEIDARSEALRLRAASAWWPGDLQAAEKYTRTAIALAEDAGRNDLWVRGMAALQWLLEMQLDFDAAEAALSAGMEHCEEGVLAQARSRFAAGSLRRMQGRLDEARPALEEARQLYLDAGAAGDAAWAGLVIGWIDVVEGDPARAARAFREAVRVFAANEDHGHLCEAQRALAEVLLAEGKVEEAERHALAANSLVSPYDLTSRSSTMTTLALVRSAQGRHAEAEQLLRDALALLDGTGFKLLELPPLVALAEFLRAHGRVDEAVELERRIPEPLPAWLGSEDARTPAAVPSPS